MQSKGIVRLITMSYCWHCNEYHCVPFPALRATSIVAILQAPYGKGMQWLTYLLFECTILIVLVITSYAWANIKYVHNMLQEEDIGLVHQTITCGLITIDRFKFMDITILYWSNYRPSSTLVTWLVYLILFILITQWLIVSFIKNVHALDQLILWLFTASVERAVEQWAQC